MYDSPKALGVQTIYVRIGDFGPKKCPYCGSTDIVEKYPSSGHSFLSMNGWKNVIQYWFECLNPDCSGPEQFKAPQPYVLPYKKFGNDVWAFICREVDRYKSGVSEIKLRLFDLGVDIDEDTIGSIVKEYQLLKSGKIDETTMAIIKKQNRIIIGVDGTPIATGESALWTFYDVISGRLLYADYLLHANEETLIKIFEKIYKNFNVPVDAFLSDHQISIVNACHTFNKDIPHQTCHYHYLRNHWVYLDTIDTHLNTELRSMVNSLGIGKSDSNGGSNYSKGIKVNKQDFFQPIVKLLKQAVNHKEEEFDVLRGVEGYHNLSKIVHALETDIQNCNSTLRPVIQLNGAIELIKNTLNEKLDLFNQLNSLYERFQRIRMILESPDLKKTDKMTQLNLFYNDLWNEAHNAAGYEILSAVKATTAKYDQTNAFIYCQWCRLWNSHEHNLFFYYDVPGLEKTNIYNEQLFSIIKRQTLKIHGQAHQKYMLLTRGENIAKDLCAKENFTVHEILTRYDLKGIKELEQPLNDRIKVQRGNFRRSLQNQDEVQLIIQKIQDRIWEKKKNPK